MHVTAQKGCFNLVKILIEDLNANMNIETLGGEVPIHYESMSSTMHMDIIKYMYDKGCDYKEDVEEICEIILNQAMIKKEEIPN